MLYLKIKRLYEAALLCEKCVRVSLLLPCLCRGVVGDWLWRVDLQVSTLVVGFVFCMVKLG